MICVDCGAEAPRLIGGSCAACFAERTPLLTVPEMVALELCASCGARHVGAHWHDVDPDAPEDWVRDLAVREAVGVHHEIQNPLLDVEEKQLDERTFSVTITLTGWVEKVEVEAEASALLRRTKGVCDRCSRIAGGYYAAIIQLRATDRDVTKQELERAHALVRQDLNRQLDGGNRFAFLAKGGPMHGGWDYYIGDIDAGRNVARILKDRLGALVTETAKLVGRREGEDVYRVTFLVRIRRFSQGDFAVHGRGVIAITAVHPKSIQAVDLETHQKMRFHEDDLSRIGGPEVVEDAVLVSVGPEGAQVLDPQSFQTVTVLLPPRWRPEGDVVPVLRHDGRLRCAAVPSKNI